MAPVHSKITREQQASAWIAFRAPEKATAKDSILSSKLEVNSTSPDAETLRTALEIVDLNTASATLSVADETVKPLEFHQDPALFDARQPEPQWHLIAPNEPLFADFEFANYRKAGSLKGGHRIGRVSVVNTLGQVVLDVYVYYRREDGMRKFYPPQDKNFGVNAARCQSEAGAQPAEKVEFWLERMFHGRTVVVHGGTNDKTAFYIRTDAMQPANQVNLIDTQDMYAYQVHGIARPGLANTAYAILGKEVQQGGHSSVEDAQTTMELYLLQHPHVRSTGPPMDPPAPPARSGGRGGYQQRDYRGGRGGRGGRGRGRGN